MSLEELRLQKRLAEAAASVVREAVLGGLPVYAKAAGPGYLFAQTPRGMSMLRVLLLREPGSPSSEESLAITPLPGAGEAVIARVRLSRGSVEIVESRPWEVPVALAMDEALMSNVEADVWRRRLEALAAGASPEGVVGGFEVLSVGDPWCLALRHQASRAVVAWANRVTGRVDVAVEWQRRWGLGVPPREVVEDAARRAAGLPGYTRRG